MNDIELHELPGLLDHIIADDRDLWIKIGMGLKAEFDEAAFDAYDNWSQTGNGYSAADCKRHGVALRATLLVLVPLCILPRPVVGFRKNRADKRRKT